MSAKSLAGVTALPGAAAALVLVFCVLGIISGYSGPLLFVMIALAAMAAIVALLPLYVLLFLGRKKKTPAVDAAAPVAVAPAASAAVMEPGDSETLDAVEDEEGVFASDDEIVDDFGFDDEEI